MTGEGGVLAINERSRISAHVLDPSRNVALVASSDGSVLVMRDMDQEAQRCTAHRWCQEAAGHTGRHRRFLAEITPEKLEMDASVSISIECGSNEPDPHLVLAVGFTGKPRFCSARLTWSQTEKVAKALTSAKERYEP